MDYDYEKYSELISKFISEVQPEQEDLTIGENISRIPEIKIIFDGFGDLETEDEEGNYVYEEGGNRYAESYAFFLHKDTLTEGFEFPEHETWFSIIHRPREEVCIYAWYDAESGIWDVLPLEDRIDKECTMNEQDVMNLLEHLNQKYFD